VPAIGRRDAHDIGPEPVEGGMAQAHHAATPTSSSGWKRASAMISTPAAKAHMKSWPTATASFGKATASAAQAPAKRSAHYAPGSTFSLSLETALRLPEQHDHHRQVYRDRRDRRDPAASANEVDSRPFRPKRNKGAARVSVMPTSNGATNAPRIERFLLSPPPRRQE